MIDGGLISVSPGKGQDPLAVALGGWGGQDRLPGADDLVSGMVRGLACLDGARSVVGVVHPGASGFFPASTGGNRCCFLASSENPEVQWTDAPAAWEKAFWSGMEAAAGVDSLLGVGPLVSGPGWPAGTADVWVGRLVSLRDAPWLGLMVTLADDADKEAISACGRQLGNLAATLETILGVWGQAVELRTRLRQMKAEARTLGRINQMQGRFVAMASHEFKTPLTSITAYADVLVERVTDEHFPQATEFLGVIKQEADRLLRMINRILDFSRMEYGSRLLDLRQVDLEPLVRETVRSLGPGIQEKGLTLDLHASRHLAQVEIDADLVRQVLVNLVGNAVKYTPNEGAITVRLAEQGAMVTVQVADNGPGIPDADMKRIFNEFYRASHSQDGTGLGLTIARHIVHLHGGHITVGPRAGGGTEFTFMLPKAARYPCELPGYLAWKDGERSQRLLLVNILRLMAELTDSVQAALILRDGQGCLAPVCAVGLDSLTSDPVSWNEGREWSDFLDVGEPLYGKREQEGLSGDLDWLPGSGPLRLLAPVVRQGRALGCLVLNRQAGAFQAADAHQVEILSRIATNCMGGMAGKPEGVLVALRALMQVRRRGVPTATAAALQLVRDVSGRLGLTEPETIAVLDATALHDAGMTNLQEDVLDEQGRLSWDQRDEVERHVGNGLEIMAPLITNPAVEAIVRHHHERFDGGGYPDGLVAGAIPVGARILAVVDTWYALTTDRPFRRGLDPRAALAEIKAHGGTQFDPRVVTALQLAVAGLSPQVTGRTEEPTPLQEL